MEDTRIDILLRKELLKIKHDDEFVNDTIDCCESQSDRDKLLKYIQNVSNDRKDVMMMALKLGIESGAVEGEFEEE